MSTSESRWSKDIPDKLIKNNEIHVWRAFLELSSTQRQYFMGILSSDELKRMKRFHFKRDEDRFIAARGILRVIMSYYIEKSPEEISFEYTSQGKPIVTENPGSDTIHFNLSHSNRFALYAVTFNSSIGIDIEFIRTDAVVEQIAQKFFSQNEIRAIQNIQEKNRTKLFFQYWTRKEALLKAAGDGISSQMCQFDVSLINEKKFLPISYHPKNEIQSQWYVRDLMSFENYVAAIAVEGGNKDLSFWNYSH